MERWAGQELKSLLEGKYAEKGKPKRVTCDKRMEIVEKVLVGKVNKQIVSKIKSNGGVSIGLSGRDHQLLKV